MAFLAGVPINGMPAFLYFYLRSFYLLLYVVTQSLSLLCGGRGVIWLRKSKHK